MAALLLPLAWQLYLKDHCISMSEDWPFLEGCPCTPGQVAIAGFNHRPTRNKPNFTSVSSASRNWEAGSQMRTPHKGNKQAEGL
ncbi:Baculoviral IAP repeat-containing protein 5 [Manis javanica]|nr:Baculoviral IAP repeat-containing protein 5 [Manis javanica]